MPEYKQLERPNYFHGKLLTAADFQQEQQYHLDGTRRRNRFLRGWGIVSGLNIYIEDGNTVVVSPGFALDCAGNELVLATPEKLSLSCLTGKHYLTIRYLEIPIAETPSLQEEIEFSRTREAVCIELADTNPAADHRGMGAGSPGCGHVHAICIATLSQRDTNWRVTPAKSSRLPKARR
ncbi:MAG: hypothetical protein V4628_04175 [Pseudomonadota bacterium]